MLNNMNTTPMEHGYVVLPVEKYNELMRAVKDAEQAAERLIQLKVDYQGQVDVKIDDEQVYTAAKKLYEASSFNTTERELIEPEKFSVWTSTFTRKPVTETEE